MSSLLRQFPSEEITLRFGEPFVTRGLNAKHAVVVAPGLYRGYHLGTTTTPFAISVTADPVSKDHVAVYETANGFALTLRQTGGTFVRNLLAFAPNTVVVIAITAEFAVGSDTTAELRAYSKTEFDGLTASERDRLLVLGTVNLPSATSLTVPETSITQSRRDTTWEKLAPGILPWSRLLRNSGFDNSVLTAALQISKRLDSEYWEFSQPTGNGGFRITGSQKVSGAHSLELATSNALPTQAEAFQRINVPVSPGQLIKVDARIKRNRHIISTGGKKVEIFFDWANATGASTGSPTVVEIPIPTTSLSSPLDSTFVALGDMSSAYNIPPFVGDSNPTEMVSVPSTGVAFLRRIGIRASSGIKFNGDDVSAPLTASLWVDNFQCWLQALDSGRISEFDEKASQAVSAGSVVLNDTSATFVAGNNGALLRFNGTTDRLVVDRKDEDTTLVPTPLEVRGQVIVGTGLSTTDAIDMSSKKIVNLADPVNDQDAVTKAYADALALGLIPKDPVRLATTTNLSFPVTTLPTIDGVAPLPGDRVLLRFQTIGSQNGIFIAANGTDWQRAPDADNVGVAGSEVKTGMHFLCLEGTLNGGSQFVLTTPAPITLGVTSLSFVKYAEPGVTLAGSGLIKTGQTISVELAPTPGLDLLPQLTVLNDPSGGTQNVGAGLQIKLHPTGGMSTDTSGLFFDFTTDGGLETDGTGSFIKLQTSKGLETTSGGLGIQFSATGGVTDAGSGLTIKRNTATPLSPPGAQGNTLELTSSGVKVVGLPQEFNINGAPVSPLVVSSDMNVLFNNQDATTAGTARLHYHTNTEGPFDIVTTQELRFGGVKRLADSGSYTEITPQGNNLRVTASANGTYALQVTNNGGDGQGVLISASDGSGTNPLLRVQDNSNNPFLTVTEAGLVGIGIAAAVTDLQINKASAGSPAVRFSNAHNTLDLQYVRDAGGSVDQLQLISGATDRFAFTSTGRLGVNTVAPENLAHIKGTVAAISATQVLLEGAQGGWGAGVSLQSPLNTSGALLEMARITSDREDSWDSTNNLTQDAGLRFFTTANGTPAEKWRITSAGVLQATGGNRLISNVSDPLSPQDAATRAYVLAQTSGLGSGDITDVIAGAGLTGGASSGAATLTLNLGTGLGFSGAQAINTGVRSVGNSVNINASASTGDSITFLVNQGVSYTWTTAHNWTIAGKTVSLKEQAIGTTTNHDFFFTTNDVPRWGVAATGHFVPVAFGAYDIGTSSLGVRHIYFDGTTPTFNAGSSANVTSVVISGSPTAGTVTFALEGGSFGAASIVLDVTPAWGAAPVVVACWSTIPGSSAQAQYIYLSAQSTTSTLVFEILHTGTVNTSSWGIRWIAVGG
jgi:hypothetical protein